MTTLVFLPTDTLPWRWLRPADGVGGEGPPPADDRRGGDARVVAVAPAEAVTLHWARLPDRSLAQATAAARLLVAEASASGAGDLHVAVGDEGGVKGEVDDRPIGVVAAEAMRRWLDELARQAIDADAIIPAPMLLPRPDAGWVAGEVGGVRVVRGPGGGFADEAGLTELVTAGEPVAEVDDAALAAALATALAAPPLDLRQGSFARARRVEIDWRLVRRLALIALAVLAVTLAIGVVRLVRLNLAAASLEARADAVARSGLPRGETITDPDRQLAERLSRVRGPGRGFSATVAAVYAAVRQVPGTEVTALAFQPDGTLLVSLAAQRESAPTDLKRAIQATGLPVAAGVFQSIGGRVTGQFTIGGAVASEGASS